MIYDDTVDTVEELERKLEGIIRVKELSKSKQPVLVILDSLAMLSTEHEMDVPDKADMTKAKKLKQITRRLTRKLSKNLIGFLVLNHTIANISPMPFAPKKTTTGGSAIPFLASVRLKTSIFKRVKNDKTKEVDGVIIQVECIKNKITRPNRIAQMFFDYRTISIGKYSGLIDLLVIRDIIQKEKVKGRWKYTFDNIDFTEKEFEGLVNKNKWLPKFNAGLIEYEKSERDKVLDISGDMSEPASEEETEELAVTE
jgi:RecA/RadA recombinase